MNRSALIVHLGVVGLALSAGRVEAQTVGTAFTYQGELFDNGTPVEGACDFAFTLHDADTGGNQLGGRLEFDAAPVENRFYYDNSSRRHKRDIRPLEDEFEKILEAEPKTYTRPGDPNRREIGYIAEDFADLGLDRLVYFDADGAPSAINYRKTAMYLNEVVKKQQKQLAALTARLERLEALVAKRAGREDHEPR